MIFICLFNGLYTHVCIYTHFLYTFSNTVFHRSIATATNHFVLQVPEATIRGRGLFEGGDYLFLINVSIYVLFICLDPLSLNAAS